DELALDALDVLVALDEKLGDDVGVVGHSSGHGISNPRTRRGARGPTSAPPSPFGQLGDQSSASFPGRGPASLAPAPTFPTRTRTPSTPPQTTRVACVRSPAGTSG